MKILDRVASSTLAAAAGIALVCAFLFLAPYLPYMTLNAQQAGPGGVPGGGGSSFTCNSTNDCAALTAANTFTQAQTIDGSLYLAGGNTFGIAPSGSANTLFVTNSSIGSFPMVLGVDGTADGLGIPSNYCFAFASTATGLTWDSFFCRQATNIYSLGSSGLGNDGWLQIAAVGNGASGNTDLRGHVTLVSGAGAYTFTKSYTIAPACVATDTTTAAAVKVSSTATSLTLTGTGTDTLDYVCAD